MAAVRYVAGKGVKTAFGSLHLACHVKPGASSKREGIIAVTDSIIELCVSAQAKEGEANKAARELIAEVLQVPKSDVEIAKGTKSRVKTVVVQQYLSRDSSTNMAEELVEGTKSALRAAMV